MSKKEFALVTGASSGIGAEFARQLAAKGYPLVLVARRTELLEKLKAEILTSHPVEVILIPQDLSEAGAAETIFRKVSQAGHRVEILVNNAGYGIQGKFMDMNLDEMHRMHQVNAITLTNLTQLFAKEMLKNKSGYILNVASASAFLPTAYVAAYAATKAYVLSMSEAVWYELKGSGVSITTLYPGVTQTEFNETAGAKHPPMMNFSILSAKRVAFLGLRAMFNRRRAIVPGFINKVNAFFCKVLPRGWVIRSAGSLMKKANRH